MTNKKMYIGRVNIGVVEKENANYRGYRDNIRFYIRIIGCVHILIYR